MALPFLPTDSGAHWFLREPPSDLAAYVPAIPSRTADTETTTTTIMITRVVISNANNNIIIISSSTPNHHGATL